MARFRNARAASRRISRTNLRQHRIRKKQNFTKKKIWQAGGAKFRARQLGARRKRLLASGGPVSSHSQELFRAAPT
eukprot:4444248-Pyramimonas_sp.AAC.1